MNSLIVPTKDIMSTTESQAESNCPEEEPRGTKRKISLSTCGVCGSEEAKYRCPACLAHSCSLLCVKKHKEDSGCSGVRNKTAFVTLSHFDEMTLLNDYRLLEDTGRFADGATRDKLVQTRRCNFKAKKLAEKGRRMNITLRFLPITFTKSKENSTVFTKEQQFLWHVKLLFPQSCTEFSQRRVSDMQTLEQILTPYIHPTDSDPVTRQKLKIYVHTPFDDVKVFMKAEGRKANSVRFHELDIRKTLRDNLSYKTLIEYPVLHVVLRDHWKEYPPKGPAEPASACNRFATKKDQREEDVIQVSPSKQGAGTSGGTNIWTGTPETSPQTEPPQVKRAKREATGEDIEEGEIIDSSDEEKEKEEEEEEGNTKDNTPCVKNGDGARSPANEMEVIKDAAADSADVTVDDGVNKGIRDQCMNKDISAASNDDMTIELSDESAEVSMTKEDAAEESRPAHTHHCQDVNESAYAADSCGLE